MIGQYTTSTDAFFMPVFIILLIIISNRFGACRPSSIAWFITASRFFWLVTSIVCAIESLSPKRILKSIAPARLFLYLARIPAKSIREGLSPLYITYQLVLASSIRL